MRIRPFQPRTPLRDIQSLPKEWRPDPDVHITNEDLYARTWQTDFGTPIFDDDKENLIPQHEREVIVDQTPTADNSSHTSGTIPRNGLKNYDVTPTMNENDEENTQFTAESEYEQTDKNEEHLRNNDQNVPQIPENSEIIPEPHSERTHLPETGPTNTRSEKYDLRHNPKPNCNGDYRY